MTTPETFDLYYYSEDRANCEPWNWYSLNDFLDEGFEPTKAQEWLDADVSPDEARHYKRLGMTASQAWEWRMVPQVVQGFRDGGFGIDDAWAWASEGIFGHEAMFWRAAGYTPAEAAAIREVSRPLAQAVVWALTDLGPADALDHATHGANPADFLRPPVMVGDEDARLWWPPFDGH
jgi:hypothetical protein